MRTYFFTAISHEYDENRVLKKPVRSNSFRTQIRTRSVLLVQSNGGLIFSSLKTVLYGPDRWSGSLFTQKRPVRTRGPDSDLCGLVDRTVTRAEFF
jgi:hypothetical protein